MNEKEMEACPLTRDEGQNGMGSTHFSLKFYVYVRTVKKYIFTFKQSCIKTF